MRTESRVGRLFPALMLFALFVLDRSTVLALTTCTAAGISSQDPGCPAAAATCRVTLSFDVGDGCTLDFGRRALEIDGSGQLSVGRGAMTIKAASLNVLNRGFILGRGNQAAPNDRGGMITIETTGAVMVQGPLGTIDVSGQSDSGMITIRAGGSVNIDGRLLADGSAGFAFGGTIEVDSDGDFITSGQSTVSADGTRTGGGGCISVTVRGRIGLSGLVDVSGGCGGGLNLYSLGDTVLSDIQLQGTGDAGSGGCMTVTAGKAVTTLDTINLNGSNGLSGGGCGGFLCLESLASNVDVREDIQAEGAPPDGGGGILELDAAGSVTTHAGKTVSARGNGGQTCGGGLCIDPGIDFNAAAFLDVSGGGVGGDIATSSGRNTTISAGSDSSARSTGGFAGTALFEAGVAGSGTLSLTGEVNVGAGGCGAGVGCGVGGLADLSGCNVSIASTGSIVSGAPDAGDIHLTAREQLTVRGMIDATTTNVAQGSNGQVLFTFPSRKQPQVSPSVVQPPAKVAPMVTCTGARQASCLTPCPVCGNGVVEYPETCDTGGGTAVSCDGCSAFCQNENCDDGLVCTVDACDPTIGCTHLQRELPPTPCFEPGQLSPTPTSTASVTPSRTQTPTVTPTPTITPTGTPSPDPSPTPTTKCTGDCDNSGQVTVDELVRGVDMLLGVTVQACPSFDIDRNGQVSVDELLAAIRFALEGCTVADR